MECIEAGEDVGRRSKLQAIKPQAASFAVDWFENRLNEVKEEIEESYKDFRLSETLKTIYSLIWDDFCSWYLEWVKARDLNNQLIPMFIKKQLNFLKN